MITYVSSEHYGVAICNYDNAIANLILNGTASGTIIYPSKSGKLMPPYQSNTYLMALRTVKLFN